MKIIEMSSFCFSSKDHFALRKLTSPFVFSLCDTIESVEIKLTLEGRNLCLAEPSE
jgi:hypothetical protein